MKAVALLTAIATTATLLGLETTARADERESCATAADQAQQSRDEGKYRRAREAMLTCARDVCPAPIKRDCLEWLTQLESIAPTIVLAAKEGTKDLSDVKVYVDGTLVTDKLDGKPVPMDLGKHKFRFEHAGQSKEEEFIIGAGQKNRSVAVVFEAASTAPVIGGPPPAKEPAGSLVPVFIVGGLGVVALGSFAFFGLSGKGEVDDLEACRGTCDRALVDKARTKLIIADISLGVGIVALGVATYMFVTRPKVEAEVKTAHASSNKVGFDFGAVNGGAMGSVGGRF